MEIDSSDKHAVGRCWFGFWLVQNRSICLLRDPILMSHHFHLLTYRFVVLIEMAVCIVGKRPR